jgi:transposase
MKVYLRSQMYNCEPAPSKLKVEKFDFVTSKNGKYDTILGEYDSVEPEWWRNFETIQSATNYIRVINS